MRERVAAAAWEVVSPRLLQDDIALEGAGGAVVGAAHGVRLGRPLGGAVADRRPAYGRELDDAADVPTDAFVVGEQPWWYVGRWSQNLATHASLRAQLRRAVRRGVAVREPAVEELREGAPLRVEVEAVVERWRRTRFLAPLSFAAAVDVFAPLTGRRWFVGEREGRVCAVAVVTPLPARRAWVVDHLVRVPGAPNGAAELLVDAVMRAAAMGRIEQVTLGLCPLAGRVPWPLVAIRRASRGLYDFQGLATFKARLRPDGWQRVLVEHPGSPAIWGLTRVLRAFAGGSLVQFALRTALRAPPAVLRALALALLPWCAALAAAPQDWFPTAPERWAWVAYDLAFAAALAFVAQRVAARKVVLPLHPLLAALATADAAYTAFHLVAGATSGWAELAWLALATAAPTFAAIVLWNGLRHRELS